MAMRWVAIVMGGLLAACSNPETDKKIADMEARLVALEEKSKGARPGAPAVADDPGEEAATELLKAANSAFEAQKYDDAKAKLAELTEKYPNTKAAKSSARLSGELVVIGRPAGELAVAEWLQGKTDFSQGNATLVVFFEEWCPHCKREVPKLEATYGKYKGKGLNMVGLTKLTKGGTKEKVMALLNENKVTYPVAQEQGQALSDNFGVRGIPAAAVVKGGQIVWRGHPAKISDAMIEGWIGG